MLLSNEEGDDYLRQRIPLKNKKSDDDLERQLSDLLQRHRDVKIKLKLDKQFLPTSSLLAKYKHRLVNVKKLEQQTSAIPNSELRRYAAPHVYKDEEEDENEEQSDNDPFLLLNSPPRGKLRPNKLSSVAHQRDYEREDVIGDSKTYSDTRKDLSRPNERKASLKTMSRPSSAPMSSNKNIADFNGINAGTNKNLPDRKASLEQLRPSTSLKYLREKRKQDEQKRIEFAESIMKEANLIQSRYYACVEEANIYAKLLGKQDRYTIFARGEEEVNHWERIKLSGVGGFRGTARRMRRLTIEVTGTPDQPSRLVSVDVFLREFRRLQTEVTKRKSLMASGVFMATEEATFGTGFDDKPLFVSSAADKLMRRHKSKFNKFKNKLNMPALCSSSKGNTIEHERNGSSPELFLSDGNGGRDVTGVVPSGGGKSARKSSRKDMEDQLRKILDSTVEVSKQLESQLRELRQRGWNATVV